MGFLLKYKGKFMIQ